MSREACLRLLVAQGGHGVHAGGSPGGQKAGEQGYRREDSHRRGEYAGVNRLQSEKKAGAEPGGGNRRGQADGQANQDEQQRLP